MAEKTIKRKKSTYTEEFKKQIVELYQSGKKKYDIIREYDISGSLIHNWNKQFSQTGSFKAHDNRSEVENELIELKKRNKQLEMEVDTLKQAALIMGRK
ncbi:MAG: transposase [Fusobacteria bacterium]|nr:transposase [Fusobacteriota bacterium]